MSLWFFIISFSLLGLIVAGLIMAQVATKEQDRILQQEHKERKAAYRLQDALDLYPVIKEFIAHERLHMLWLNRCEQLLEEFAKSSLGQQQQPAIKQQLQLWFDHQSTFAEQNWQPKPIRAPENDSELKTINKICHRLRQLLVDPNLLVGPDERSSLTEFLQVFQLKSELAAYDFQGQLCADEGDRSAAVAYFKHAKELVLTSKLSYEGRTQDIKYFSKKITSVYISHEDEASSASAKEESESEESYGEQKSPQHDASPQG